MNFLDLFYEELLPSTFLRIVLEQERRVCCLILGVKGLNNGSFDALDNMDSDLRFLALLFDSF